MPVYARAAVTSKSRYSDMVRETIIRGITVDLKCQYESFEEERKRLNEFDFILFQLHRIHIEHIFIGHSILKLRTAHRPFAV